MTPRLVDANQDSFWAATMGHRWGGLFSSAPWMQAVARTYGFTISAALHSDSKGVNSALPFSRISDLRGERVVCGPFCDYCDPLAEDAEAWNAVITPVLAMRLPVTLRCLRNVVPTKDPRFTVTGRAAWHSVDLSRAEADLWHGFDGSARQNVRKAQRSGVAVREGRSLEDVRKFFDMHCYVRKEKYRLLPQPFALFEELHAAFTPGDRIIVLLAEYGGAVVAGILFLQWHDTLYYKFNASVEQKACPNDLLIWEGIRMGQRRKLRQLDFGASDYEQPGLLRYKSKYATDQREILRLRWQPPDYTDTRASEARALLSRMTELLTDPGVPDAVTRVAGEALYAQFC
jgi:CelD/BcsL family acetyltransferase involved in cellulose biosynthesis